MIFLGGGGWLGASRFLSGTALAEGASRVGALDTTGVEEEEPGTGPVRGVKDGAPTLR